MIINKKIGILYDEELRGLCSSPRILRVVRCMLQCAGHTAGMEETT
jgi:hypothetical protein